MSYFLLGIFVAMLAGLWVLCSEPSSEYERKEVQKYKDSKK